MAVPIIKIIPYRNGVVSFVPWKSHMVAKGFRSKSAKSRKDALGTGPMFMGLLKYPLAPEEKERKLIEFWSHRGRTLFPSTRRNRTQSLGQN